MKVSHEWLQDYIGKKLSAADMASYLEQAGIEVEEIISSKKLDQNIVVGLVKKVVQHPNADRLKIADVELGGHKIVKVVCGGPNLAEGQTIALAQVGSVLPDGLEIKAAEIRGEKSNGMICSQQELGLGDDHAGIMVLDSGLRLGTPLYEVYGGTEVIDLTTSANRSDLQSVIGLAREVAAMANVPLKLPQMREIRSEGRALKVVVESEKAARYLLQEFELDARHQTSRVARKHLEAQGTRSINIAVDITNYVLHEYGQPLHAFDADKVQLPITVRMAKKGEKLVTLDETERSLTTEDLVIADASGVIALAGVMGGQKTAVTTETKRILVESATFDGVTIRKTAVRHGLRTDASARYERGLPVELAAIGMQRAGDIIAAAVKGAPTSKRFDSLKKQPVPRTVNLRLARLDQILGMPVAPAVVRDRLQRLGFEVQGKETLLVRIPWWRTDVGIEEDLIEEVGRSIGYDDLPATLPAWNPSVVRFDRRQAKLWQLKAALRSLGMFEVVTYSFVSAEQLQNIGYQLDEHLKLQNPLSSEQAYLRSSLLPSLLSAAAANVRYSNDFGIFELSRVFDAPTDRSQLPDEPLHVASLRRTDFVGVREVLDVIAREWHLQLSVEPAEIVGLHPYRGAQVSLHGNVIGVLGEIHPVILKQHKLGGTASFIELDLDVLLAAAGDAKYQPISKYPSITRDVAVVVSDTVSWADITRALHEYDVAYLSEYRGNDIAKGCKSLALRLTFVSYDRTLTDKEAEAMLAKAVEILKTQFKAKPRG